MDRLEKINELKKLKKQLKSKEIKLLRLEEEVEELEEKQEELEKSSSLPVLLFKNSFVSHMRAYEGNDWKTEYIYYLPDLDGIYYFGELLDNTIDARDYLIKKECDYISSKYDENDEDKKTIKKALGTIKKLINNLFEKHSIESWEELGKYLLEEINKEEKPEPVFIRQKVIPRRQKNYLRKRNYL